MLGSSAVKLLSEDAEKESQKVRSMYETGSNLSWEAGAQPGIAEILNASQAAAEAGTSKWVDCLAFSFLY